jgi:paraquat-inducible protein B
MSDQDPSADSIPEIEVRKQRGISIVWLIPLVAAIVGGWLAYTTLSEKGPTITISFKTATGLEAAKTKIKLKDVEMGLVDTITIAHDLSRIIVTASLDKKVEPHLNENTRFWVVRPRLGVGGVSGLDTLVSGAYIEIDPGDGKPSRDFVGLEEPPVVRSDEPGREFLLVADDLGSLSTASPIYYRGIEVGEVFDYKLAEDNRSVGINIFVRKPFDDLVRDNSRFWNASGIDISVDTEGLKIDTESLRSILAGGVAFESPPSTASEPAKEGTSFALYKDRDSVRQLQFVEKIPYLTQFEGSVRGLQVGAPVEYRGIRIGTVSDIRADFDAENQKFRIPVTIEIEPGRLGPNQSRRSKDPYENAKRLVARGLRTQLISGNLLTGQLLVSLDFFPDAEPAELDRSGLYPLIPSVPSQIDQFKQSITGILETLGDLKLPELIADARQALQGINRLVASPEILQAIESLESAIKHVESLTTKVDNKIGPLMTSLTTTSDTAKGTLTQAESTLVTAEDLIASDSQTVYSLNEMLRKLTEASDSIRILADYLESHPEALLRGKGGEALR